MARRIELGSIASGLIGSFSSRNNDVDGYWGIGKLHKFVESDLEKKVVIDLISGTIHPQTDEFNSLIELYRERLDFHLKARGLPREWVTSVEITVSFETEYEAKHHFWRSGLGKPYIAKCDIKDDSRKHYISHAYNNCRPHDPKREARSSRATSF
jgi:hypothetical protein